MKKYSDPLTEQVITYYALYEIPATIFKKMKMEHGENSLTMGAIRNIRTKYRADILKKRQELVAKIPVLDPMERFGYLQQIIDGALEPIPIFDRQGNQVGEMVDRKNALAALKTVHDQTHVEGSVQDDDYNIIQAIVMETFDEMVKAHPNKSKEDILNEIQASLGDKVAPFIADIKANVVH